MLNAVNALSEDSSIFTVGLFSNMYLLYAIALSVGLHCMILYIPFFERVFNTVPLTLNEWMLVLGFSFPVIILDEILKVFARMRNKREKMRRLGHK